MKIIVFMGGSSAEREVSLMSGKAVAEGLEASGYDVSTLDVEWKNNDTLFSSVKEAVDADADVIFSVLHGGLGENGGVQGILEAAGLVYTGSGISASAIAMNKHLSKTLFRQIGVPTPDWVSGPVETIDRKKIVDDLGFPCIIKPVDQGSSVGISIVDESREIEEALGNAGQYGGEVMAEKFISGAELSVPVLGNEALPVIEIRPTHAMYDYECKYTAGKSEYMVPAPITGELSRELQRYALKISSCLGLRDYGRIDFRLDEDGNPFCFEANTLPGMTSTSLVPKSAASADIDFPTLVSRITEMAFQRKGK